MEFSRKQSEFRSAGCVCSVETGTVGQGSAGRVTLEVLHSVSPVKVIIQAGQDYSLLISICFFCPEPTMYVPERTKIIPTKDLGNMC